MGSDFKIRNVRDFDLKKMRFECVSAEGVGVCLCRGELYWKEKGGRALLELVLCCSVSEGWSSWRIWQ